MTGWYPFICLCGAVSLMRTRFQHRYTCLPYQELTPFS